MDRKRYSKNREQALWDAVDDTLTKLRMEILRGGMVGLGQNKQEDFVYKHICRLPDLIAEIYRKRLNDK